MMFKSYKREKKYSPLQGRPNYRRGVEDSIGGWHLGRNRTWHPEAIYRCRTEHGNMRPTAQDER